MVSVSLLWSLTVYMQEAEWSHPEVCLSRENLNPYVTLCKHLKHIPLITDLKNGMINLLFVALQFPLITCNP